MRNSSAQGGEGYSEAFLLAQLAEDSEFAFRKVFELYHSKIYKVAMMYVKSIPAAEEIVQDVFLKLWTKRKTLQSIQSLESWLFIVTKNHTFNVLKKQANELHAKDKWAEQAVLIDDTLESKVISSDYQRLINEAILRLPPQQQKIYRLAKEQGMSYEAIGNELALSPLTVKTHMARALAALRILMNSYMSLIIILLNFFLR